MRRIYLSVLAIVATLALVGGATYAVFSDPAISGPNTFATGNADLKIDKEGDGLGFSNEVSGVNFSQLYPGWNSGEKYRVKLKNDSTSPISLKVIPQVKDTGTTNTTKAAMYNHIYLQFFDSSGNAVGESKTLNWWAANSDWGLEILAQNKTSNDWWTLRFSIPYETGDQNWMQGGQVECNVIFNGIQVMP